MYFGVLRIIRIYSICYEMLEIHGNGGRMHVILNGEPLEELDCFKYLGRKWQLMEDVNGMWYPE